MTQKDCLYNLNFLSGYYESVMESVEDGQENREEVINECSIVVETCKTAKEYLNAWEKAKEEITRLLNADVPTKKSGLIEALYIMNKLEPESEG